jgi:ABC-2 type transport system permease protein
VRAPEPAATPPRAHSFTQVVGLVRKDIVSVARQPRLLVMLVAGPFLILLFFAVGYDQEQSVLTTAFVGPEGSIFEESIEQFADDLKEYVVNAGYSDDVVAAEERLQSGEIDLVVVFPADPLEDVMAGNPATISVLHDKLDPIQQIAVEVSAEVAVQELNARILEEIVSEAQATLRPADQLLSEISPSIDSLDAAVGAGDQEAVRSAVTDLETSVTELSSLLAVSAAFDEALGVAEAGSVAGAGDALAELRERTSELDDELGRVLADADDIDAGDVQSLRQRVDEVTGMAETVVTIDPSVVVRPFASETASLQRQPVGVIDYFAPAAAALLLQHMVLTFAAMSLVSDRSRGMFELFRVGPIAAGRVLIGKYLAFLVVGVVAGGVLLASMVALLDVPMRGSTGWLAVGLGGLLLASIGFGAVLSLAARSDVQAVQFAMLALLASLFFGGFFLALDAFHYPVKLLSWALPVTYGIRLFRDVMLRGTDPEVQDLVGLAATTVVFAAAAFLMLRRELRTR